MEAQQLLGVLLNTSERQSQITQQLLDQFQAQIAALNLATDTAQKAALRVDASATQLSLDASHVTPTLQHAVSDAVGSAVKATLADASEIAVTAMEDASQPMFQKLSRMILAISDAEDTLLGATASFGWKWLTLAGATLVLALAAFLLSVWLLTEWQRHELDVLATQKEQLSAEVGQLQTQAEALAKKGGRISLSQCGPKNRLCVEITPSQGQGVNDFQGAWSSKDKKKRYVIAQGY